MPVHRYNAPTKLVALLKAMKVRPEIPDTLEANVHRIASDAEIVNSAKPNTVSCDATLRMKILHSLQTSFVKCILKFQFHNDGSFTPSVCLIIDSFVPLLLDAIDSVGFGPVPRLLPNLEGRLLFEMHEL